MIDLVASTIEQKKLSLILSNNKQIRKELINYKD
jgi:hypothetical protein